MTPETYQKIESYVKGLPTTPKLFHYTHEVTIFSGDEIPAAGQGASREEAETDLMDTILTLWVEYVEDSVFNLAPDALELRADLIKMFGDKK